MHYLYSLVGWLLFFAGGAWAIYAIAGGGEPVPDGMEGYALIGRYLAAAPGFGLAGFGLLMSQLAGIGLELSDIRRYGRRTAEALEAIRRDQGGE